MNQKAGKREVKKSKGKAPERKLLEEIPYSDAFSYDLQCKKATSIRKINGIPICRKHRREEPVLNL